jgi:hypothetical protein
MARYREGEIPKEQLAVHASDDMLILTAVLGFLIGIVITYLGRKGEQMWMWVWGIGLIICSAYLGLSMTVGLKLFGHF